MRYGLDVAVQAKVNQPAVLFLHAFPLNQDMWAPQMAALRDAGVAYIAFDYPGMGASLPWSHVPRIEDYAELAYRVGREAGVEQAIVVGLSMGGYVAFALFRQHPEFFNGLILADTRATADPPEGKQRRYQLIQNIQQTGDLDEIIQFHVEKFFTAESRQKRPELVVTARRLMQRATNQGVIHALQAMAERPDSMELLPEMNFPVRVIVGEADELTQVADSRKMVEKLPHGELITIPGAAHLSNLECPQAFNHALIDFVKKI